MEDKIKLDNNLGLSTKFNFTLIKDLNMKNRNLKL